MGSNKAFGSRDVYFKTHGNMKLFAKKTNFNLALSSSNFPDETSFEYSNLESLGKEIF